MSNTSAKSRQADLAVQLLSDLAPELALRWIHREISTSPNSPLPPALYRSLLSFLLRGATRSESLSAYDALQACLALPTENAGAALGFTTFSSHTTICSILLDMLNSAARCEPLIPTAPALVFYAEAGPGAGDADEYYTGNGAGERLPFCTERDPLARIREDNLAMALTYVADVFSKYSDTSELISEAVSHDRPAFLTPLVELLPRMVDAISPAVMKGMQRFYGAYVRTQSEVIRGDIISKLNVAFMKMALEKPDSLGVYISSIADPEMKFSACKMCLVQRYKVYESANRAEFGLSQILKHFLAVRSNRMRVNTVVPALLTGLIMGWYSFATQEDFMMRGTHAVRDAIQTLASAKARICSEKFGACERDVIAFDMAIMALSHMIIDSNS